MPIEAAVVRGFAEMKRKLGCAPTVLELAGELHMRPSDIDRAYDALEKRGLLFRLPGRDRGVNLLQPPP
jgi:DNA-binding MarR family transcriptional regulator